MASQQDRFTATRTRVIDAAQNMFIKEGGGCHNYVNAHA